MEAVTPIYKLNPFQEQMLLDSSMLSVAHVLERTAEWVFLNGGSRSVGLSLLTREAENRLIRESVISYKTYKSQAASLLLIKLYTPSYSFYTTLTCVNALLLAAEARYQHSIRKT